jgi:hypothetical protein
VLNSPARARRAVPFWPAEKPSYKIVSPRLNEAGFGDIPLQI